MDRRDLGLLHVLFRAIVVRIVAGSETVTWLVESGEARAGEEQWKVMRSKSSADIQTQAPFNLGSSPDGDDGAMIVIATCLLFCLFAYLAREAQIIY